LGAWHAAHPRAGRPAGPGSPSAAGLQPTTVARCIACHGGDIAPRIPFGDPAALAPLLVTGEYPRGRLLDEVLFRLTPEAGPDRMPRGMNIDDDGRRTLERYFLSVAARAAR
jgi:mono/diheme cytochrome c family protein